MDFQNSAHLFSYMSKINEELFHRIHNAIPQQQGFLQNSTIFRKNDTKEFKIHIKD